MEDISYIKSLLEEVLEKAHTDPKKRIIKCYPARLEMSCPVCGDSDNYSKKRGNLYLDSLWYKCFRCEASMSFTKLMDKSDIVLDFDFRMKAVGLQKTSVIRKSKELPQDIRWAWNLQDIMTASKEPGKFLTNITPLEKDSVQWNYITSRKIPLDKWDSIYQAWHWKKTTSSGYWEPVIIILNNIKDQVLGLQIRNIKEGDKRWFKIWNWETIGKELNLSKEYTEEEAEVYNEVSGLVNILKIDPSYPVTITEGFFDACFIPNSIAIMGIGKEHSLKMIQDAGLEIRFFLDNDSAGFRKAITLLNNGNKVFLWKKWIDEISLTKPDPWECERALNSLKDLNDLGKAIKNVWTKTNMEKYFGNSPLDQIWVPRK